MSPRTSADARRRSRGVVTVVTLLGLILIAALVFWVLNIVKFVPYAFLGMFTAQTFLANLYLAPFALLGTWIGVRAHHVVPERLFFAITYVLLLVTGGKLIWDGLT